MMFPYRFVNFMGLGLLRLYGVTVITHTETFCMKVIAASILMDWDLLAKILIFEDELAKRGTPFQCCNNTACQFGRYVDVAMAEK